MTPEPVAHSQGILVMITLRDPPGFFSDSLPSGTALCFNGWGLTAGRPFPGRANLALPRKKVARVEMAAVPLELEVHLGVRVTADLWDFQHLHPALWTQVFPGGTRFKFADDWFLSLHPALGAYGYGVPLETLGRLEIEAL